MLNIFDNLKTFFTYRRITTEGLVFKMHYRATVCIILAFCLMVAARQYVGDPINCIHGNDLHHDVINTFCWIHSTFSVKSAFLKKVGIDISHPGIASSLGGQQPRREYRYYQWVVFFLLLQVSGRFKFTVPWHVTTCSVIDGCKLLRHCTQQAVGSPETSSLNPLNAELSSTCHLLALLGAHHILHISKIRVNFKALCHISEDHPIGTPCRAKHSHYRPRRDLRFPEG
jgi:hypothetical protein